MKGQTQLVMVARTIERSGAKKDGKFAYLFVDADEKTPSGLYVGKDAYTYWTETDFKDAKMGDKFNIRFETFGESIVIRDASPVKAA